MDQIFFLSDIYLVVLLLAGIGVGLIVDRLSDLEHTLSAGILFGLFSVGQLIFRLIVNNEQPGRLVGQVVYFYCFLIIIFITGKAKARFV